MSGETRDGERILKLFCPSLSKAVPYVAWEEQKLDLGAIARAFGLDPTTLKLNGHFIGRGVDFIASSVTWRSLLSFFAQRGLATGAHDGRALVVDGRLCKAGTKRVHNPADDERGIHSMIEHDDASSSGPPQLGYNNLLKKKKSDESYWGCENGGNQVTRCNDPCLKRKNWLEDTSPLKRLKMNKTITDSEGCGDNLSCSNLMTGFPCSYVSENMKRMREDEKAMAADCKKS